MGINLRQKKLRNNERSLYLDIIVEKRRHTETLNLRLVPEKGLADRKKNKETKELAERIKTQRWNDIINNSYGLKIIRGTKVNFFEFADELIPTFQVAKRPYLSVVKMLKAFNKSDILFTTNINDRFLNQFYTYMESRLTGETPSTYFKKLKRLLKDATKQKLFEVDPSLGIRCRKFVSKQKAVLTFEEIKLLANAKCPNDEVKDAFILCLLCGIRFGDVKALKGSHIIGNKLELIQRKTKVKICGILNSDALTIISGRIKKDALIFHLPSHTACLKNLRKWALNAGIDKSLSWHCSRHGFATNLILNGTDIYTTSTLLGHKSLVHTQRYVRESNKMKEEAVNNLPKLF